MARAGALRGQEFAAHLAAAVATRTSLDIADARSAGARCPSRCPMAGRIHTGRTSFEDFFAKTPGGTGVWDSFSSHVDQVIEADGYFAVQCARALFLRSGVSLVGQGLCAGR